MNTEPPTWFIKSLPPTVATVSVPSSVPPTFTFPSGVRFPTTAVAFAAIPSVKITVVFAATLVTSNPAPSADPPTSLPITETPPSVENPVPRKPANSYVTESSAEGTVNTPLITGSLVPLTPVMLPRVMIPSPETSAAATVIAKFAPGLAITTDATSPPLVTTSSPKSFRNSTLANVPDTLTFTTSPSPSV